jgi:hypothetical protein
MSLGENFGKSVTDFMANNPWKTAAIVGTLLFLVMQMGSGGFLGGLFNAPGNAVKAGTMAGVGGLALSIASNVFGFGQGNAPEPGPELYL